MYTDVDENAFFRICLYIYGVSWLVYLLDGILNPYRFIQRLNLIQYYFKHSYQILITYSLFYDFM